ncbi:response regulator transcription factor [Micromonospora sp. LOL_024]|uniref:response regulator transcription factor n=1 Tax=Micromonospora sp. LOL_024 TaxID=3345412 RepID=UPI003A83869E
MGDCVVVVEDHAQQRGVLRLYLEREGYRVVEAADGPAALSAIRANDPDLVLLDLMLPTLSGREVCRIIRTESDVPVVVISGLGGEDEVMSGLDLGADDYVVKPYRPRELMARLRAVRRRAEAHTDTSRLRYADLLVEADKRAVHQRGRSIALTASEFDILVTLLGKPGRVFTRAQLLSRVEAYGGTGLERTVDVHVRNIRRKLGDDPAAPRYIATVVGLGYKAP